MSSLHLNWRNSLFLPVAALLAACTTTGSEDWVRVQGLDGGGFSVSMPHPSDEQHGSMPIDGESVSTHINILADSGVVYVAAWFELPDDLRGLAPEALNDHIWPQVVSRSDAIELDEPGPIAAAAGSTAKSGWLMTPGGSRMGLVIQRSGDRMVIMNAAIPDQYMEPSHRKNMERYLRSFRAGS